MNRLNLMTAKSTFRIRKRTGLRLPALAFALTLPLPLLAVACTEQIPKQIPGASPSPTTPSTTVPTNTVPTATLRTVETRSPFGELRSDNLFLDGDFEFTGRNGQMPWLVFRSNGQGTIGFDTGGKCFSGVRSANVSGF